MRLPNVKCKKIYKEQHGIRLIFRFKYNKSIYPNLVFFKINSGCLCYYHFCKYLDKFTLGLIYLTATMKRENLSRRNFLRTSFVGAAGISIGSKAISSEVQKNEKPRITIRKLGNTDLVLPIVSMGVMRSDNPNLVKAALETGIKHFDTAHGYQQGNNEIMLGNFFKNYPRDSFSIATKVHPDGIDRKTGEIGIGSTKEAFLEKVNISLQRLQMEYVDILFHHSTSTAQAVKYEPVLDALVSAKKAGKTRYIGVSTHSNEPEVIQAAIDTGVIDVVLTAINFKQDHYPQLKEKIALAAEKGIGIIAMKTMAGAFLDKERTQPINCKAALKWVLKDPNVHTSIPGITSIDALIQNWSVTKDLELSEDELKDLREAGLVAGLYCDGCSQCDGSCQKGLPVKDIMRAYMYAYGYNDFKQAQHVMKQLKVDAMLCNECEICSVKCYKYFNVAEKISDINRISGIPEDFLS